MTDRLMAFNQVLRLTMRLSFCVSDFHKARATGQ